MYVIYSVEDDPDISKIIRSALSKQGYEVQSFVSGEDALNALSKKKPNMILLDMMLPNISGQELLKEVRSKDIYDDIDIIIVSANHMLMDKIDGFDLGADDYIEKPFNLLELMARVESRVRRNKRKRIIKVQDIKLDLNKHSCYRGEEEVFLTSKEFSILSLLLENIGTAITRTKLLNQIWGIDVSLETRAIDMHVKALRKKLHDDKGRLIKTVYGVGYRIDNE